MADKLAIEVKEAAFRAGADLVGVVPVKTAEVLPKTFVGWIIQDYTKRPSEIMLEAKSVIILAFHVWDDILEAAIKKSGTWVYPGYAPLQVLEIAMITYLKAKGFVAVPFYSSPLKKLAQLAGFGNFGKNALVINRVYGPWLRLTAILTDAEIKPDRPFEKDLCGTCDECVKACPTGALTPYTVDDTKCLVGIHLQTSETESQEYSGLLSRYEPSLTKNTHLMCMACQKACKYGQRNTNEQH